jgi:hypothetical protein
MDGMIEGLFRGHTNSMNIRSRSPGLTESWKSGVGLDVTFQLILLRQDGL